MEKWNKLPQKNEGHVFVWKVKFVSANMQTTIFTNVSHIKMQNENYIFASNEKKHHQNTLLVWFQGVLIHVIDHSIPWENI